MSSVHKIIQKEVSVPMKAWAAVLDETFNGKDCKPEDLQYGFTLLVFKLGEDDGVHRINYISNCKRKNMIKAMREFIAREAMNN